MLGIVSIRQGEISQAIAQFNEALRLQPDDVYAAENLRRAQAMEITNALEAALKSLPAAHSSARKILR